MPYTWSEQERQRLRGCVLTRREISPVTYKRYRSRDSEAHFNDVAQELAGFDDEALAVAGYLHGVTDEEATALAEEGAISAEAANLVRGRQRLRSLTEDSSATLTQQITLSVLPSVDDLRSALLLVIEQIRHADPDDSGRRFTLQFHDAPPARLPSIGSTSTSHADAAGQARFLRIVCGAIARYLGMWELRNIAEDLAVYHENPAHLQRVLDSVNRGPVQEGLRSVVKQVRDGLVKTEESEFTLHAVRWEWHHAATIHSRLGTRGYFDLANLHRVGMVTVVCDGAAECYSILHRLHALDRCTVIPGSLEDHFVLRHRSGYKALHTELVFDEIQRVPVRILAKCDDRVRFEVYNAARYRSIQAIPHAENSASVVVFSPKGKPVPLVPGSTVINLAAAISTRLVARAGSATINGVPGKSIFEPLHHGDVVKVDWLPQPKFLPADWREKVPKRLWGSVIEAFREGYKDELELHGQAIVRARVMEALDQDVLHEDTINALVEEAGEDLLRRPDVIRKGLRQWPPQRGAAFWLRQIALCDIQDPARILKPMPLFAPLCNNLFDLLIEKVSLSPSVSLMDHVTVPAHFIDEFDQLTQCPLCKPQRGQKVCGKIEDRILLLHRNDAPCGDGCVPIGWKSTHRYGEYIVIHGKDRIGLAADVLRAAADLSVDVIEHIGSPLGDTAVLRLYVRRPSHRQYQALYAQLELIAGVTRFIGPGVDHLAGETRVRSEGEGTVPFLEGSLPPRRTVSPAAYRSFVPYSVGAPIKLDYQFYGRERETRDLFFKLSEVSSDGGTGKGVMIMGPLRYGKSSLLHKFIQNAEARDPKTFGVYAEFTEYAWKDFTRLTQQILKKIGEEREAEPGVHVLIDLIEKLTQKFKRVVIGIDEAVGLLGAEPSKGLQVMQSICSIPGVLLILSTFQRGFRKLGIDQSLLTKFDEVVLQPLNEDDAEALLTASRHRPALGIYADRQVVRHLLAETGGNPYWLSLIADDMYHSCRSGTAYSRDQVDASINRLFGDDLWLRHVDRDLSSLEDKLLDTFIGRGPLDFPGLLATLKSTAHEYPSDELEEALMLLQGGGLLRREERSGRYMIAAPVLLRYLRNKRGYSI